MLKRVDEIVVTCDIHPLKKGEIVVVIPWKFESSLGNSMAYNVKISERIFYLFKEEFFMKVLSGSILFLLIKT